jgi:hypothetical protein
MIGLTNPRYLRPHISFFTVMTGPTIDTVTQRSDRASTREFILGAFHDSGRSTTVSTANLSWRTDDRDRSSSRTGVSSWASDSSIGGGFCSPLASEELLNERYRVFFPSFTVEAWGAKQFSWVTWRAVVTNRARQIASTSSHDAVFATRTFFHSSSTDTTSLAFNSELTLVFSWIVLSRSTFQFIVCDGRC